LWRWENLPEGQPSLQYSTNHAFKVEWQNGSHFSVKAHDSLLGVCERHLKTLKPGENILWSVENKINSLA
jgi:hypothetical protein